MLEFFAILAVALTGGALPLLFKWNDRQFHAALALSSGVFLGAVFLHLLPMVGAIAGTGHAALVFGPSLGGGSFGDPALHDHDGDGVPDHLAAQHAAQASDPGAALVDPGKTASGPATSGQGTSGPGTSGPGTSGQGASGPGAGGQGAGGQGAGAPATGAATGAAPAHSHGSPTAWLWVLLGVVGVYFVEALLVPGHHNHPHQAGCGADGAPAPQVVSGHDHAHDHGHDHAHDHGHDHGQDREHHHGERRESQRHRAVGWAALVGLSVHSLTSGVALAAVAEDEQIASVMLWAILAHKGFESFSLASVFSMTSREPRQVLALVVAFSFVTPLGLLLGHQVTALFGTGGIAVLTALAAGTFLYVCIGELLPEVFHHREDVFLKIALLCAGVAGMYLVHTVGGA
jgi:zinc and cadmium transporter